MAGTIAVADGFAARTEKGLFVPITHPLHTHTPGMVENLTVCVENIMAGLRLCRALIRAVTLCSRGRSCLIHSHDDVNGKRILESLCICDRDQRGPGGNAADQS